jgi:hypothetical protein
MRASHFIVMFSLMLSVPICVAQQPQRTPPYRLGDFDDDRPPSSCAERTAILDVITQRVATDELIIVIARLGYGETRPNLNHRRLHNVRIYWTEYLNPEGRRRPETIVLAEAERIRGYGRLEFYVGGTLEWVMKVARNADLDVLPCYPEDFDEVERTRVFDPCRLASARNFYPCRNRNRRLRNRR